MAPAWIVLPGGGMIGIFPDHGLCYDVVEPPPGRRAG